MDRFALDRLALAEARRLQARQPRMDLTISQLPLITPSSTDLIPVYHQATGQTYGATVSSILSTSASATTSKYDATILAETSLVHFFKMNEAAGATTLADTQSSTVLTIAPQSINTIAAGAASIITDLEASVRIGYAANTASAYSSINLPGSLWSGISGDFSVELLWGDLWSLPLSNPVDSPMLISTVDPAGSLPGGFEIFQKNASAATFGALSPWGVNGHANGVLGGSNFSGPDFAHIVLTLKSTVGTLYINGCPLLTNLSGPSLGLSVPSTSVTGKIGCRSNGNQFPQVGRVSKFAIYNAALNQTQIEAHLNNVH